MNVPGKDMFALDTAFLIKNLDESHWTCAVIFMEDKRIQYYNSMGSNGHAYKTGLMRYLNYGWYTIKGGELPDSDKWNILGAVDGMLQQHFYLIVVYLHVCSQTFFLMVTPFILARI